MFNKMNLRSLYVYSLLLIALVLIVFSFGLLSLVNITFITILFALLLMIDYFDLFKEEGIYFNVGLKIIIVFVCGWSMAALLSSLAILVIYILKKRNFDYRVFYLFSKEYISTAFSGWLILKIFSGGGIYIKPYNALIGASILIVLIAISEFIINYFYDLFTNVENRRDNLKWLEEFIFISLLSTLFSYISFFLWFNNDHLLSCGFILFSLFFIVLIYMQNKRKNQIKITFKLINNINKVLEDVKKTEGINELSNLLLNNETLKNLIKGYYYLIVSGEKQYERMNNFKYIELVNEIKNHKDSMEKNKIEEEYGDIMVIKIGKRDIRGVICLIVKNPGDSLFSKKVNSYINDYFKYIFDNIQVRDKLEKDYAQTIEAIVSLMEARIPSLKGHSLRVSYYSYMLGKLIGMKGKELENLRISGFLHDIGMINVPESILRKPYALSNKEFEVIKKHPITGFNLIKNIEHLKGVLTGVLEHHEKMNGSGYPQGLKGDKISVQGKIVAITDTFDAMLSKRPYRGSLTLDFTEDYLNKKRDILYDRNITDIFVKGIREKHISIIRRDDDIVF
ncbi:MAG: HD domain-containing protein [Proteobacteria bacterium]|nr:HD domain-containing protein [Pseudomonadota bacterium]